MAIQMSVAVRNARLNAIETTIGTSAVLKVRTGAQPASCAASDAGTVLATYSLNSDWAAAASSGSKALNDLPLSATASASGTAGHWRVYASDGTTCGMQGSVGAGSGDLNLDTTTITNGQTVNITGWTITDGNA